MPDLYSRLDVWETLKGHLLDAAPRLATRLEELRREAWRSSSVPEAQLLAVMVHLDFDVESAAARRKARHFLKELLDGLARPDSAGAVRETPPELIECLDERQRAQLSDALLWIGEDPPAQWLGSISGPRAAVAHVHRHAKALDRLRAYRWLAALGYPIVVPDNPRQRVLLRLGWMQRLETSKGGRADALVRCEELARELGAPLAELDVLLAAFSGADGDSAREAALCVTVPRCQQCPLRNACPHYQSNGKEIQARSRSLLATTRREQRPRERLEHNGPAALSDEELIAILLRTGSGGMNAVDLAQELLRHADSLDRLAAMSVAEMSRFRGLGRVKAITIKAALELARRLRQGDPGAAQPRMTGARQVFDMLRPQFVAARKEEFLVLLLDTKLQLMRKVPVSTGTLNQSLVHPREVFTEAIRDSAHAVIFVHNHPSGDPTPSRDDVAVTTKLVRAGDIVGIQVLDHIIIGNERYYSFADEGKLR